VVGTVIDVRVDAHPRACRRPPRRDVVERRSLPGASAQITRAASLVMQKKNSDINSL